MSWRPTNKDPQRGNNTLGDHRIPMFAKQTTRVAPPKVAVPTADVEDEKSSKEKLEEKEREAQSKLLALANPQQSTKPLDPVTGLPQEYIPPGFTGQPKLSKKMKKQQELNSLGSSLGLNTRNQKTRNSHHELAKNEKLQRSRLFQQPGISNESVFLIPGIQNMPYSEAQMEIAFEAIDSRRQGCLNNDALRDALQLAGETVTEIDIRNMIRLCDADAGGNLSYDEFRSLFANPSALFKNFDSGNVGIAKLNAIKDENKITLIDKGEDFEARRLAIPDLVALIESLAPQGKIRPPWIKQIYERFLRMDSDGVGLLNYQEMLQVLERKDNPELEKLYKHFDQTGSGDIELRDFIVGISIWSNASTIDKLKFAYLIFDDDSSGFLERDEVKELLRACHPERKEDIIENLTNELYEYLELQPVHRISFEMFMQVGMEKPRLLLTPLAQNRAVEPGNPDGPVNVKNLPGGVVTPAIQAILDIQKQHEQQEKQFGKSKSKNALESIGMIPGVKEGALTGEKKEESQALQNGTASMSAGSKELAKSGSKEQLGATRSKELVKSSTGSKELAISGSKESVKSKDLANGSMRGGSKDPTGSSMLRRNSQQESMRQGSGSKQ